MAAPSWEDILRIADRLTPELRREVWDAIEQLRYDLDVEALARAIASDKVIAAQLAAEDHALAADLQRAVDVTVRALEQAGSAAVANLVAAGASHAMRFDVTNPHAVAYARTIAAQFVTRVTVETRQALRATIDAAFSQGRDARDTAKILRSIVGLNDRQAAALLTYRTQLETSGLAAGRVELLVDRYGRRLLAQRADMIARTEIMAASNYGQQAAWMEAIDAGYLRPDALKKWVVTPDDVTCLRCRAMAGQTVAVARPFVSPDGDVLLAPPLHPHCRCVPVLYLARNRRAA